MSPELSRLTVPALTTMATTGVEVWSAELDGVNAGRTATLAGFLDNEERARAARFRFERDRRRYEVARGLLRELLGRRLGIGPTVVRFCVGPHGKPALDTDVVGETGASLRFNISHSGGRALFALADRGRDVGVDVESAARLGGARDLPGLAARTLAPDDLVRWDALPEREKLAAFLRAWTRVEAYGKATGGGLAGVLGQVRVTFAAGEPARLLTVPVPEHAEDWALHDLPVGVGWAGALVVAVAPGNARG